MKIISADEGWECDLGWVDHPEIHYRVPAEVVARVLEVRAPEGMEAIYALGALKMVNQDDIYGLRVNGRQMLFDPLLASRDRLVELFKTDPPVIAVGWVSISKYAKNKPKLIKGLRGQCERGEIECKRKGRGWLIRKEVKL